MLEHPRSAGGETGHPYPAGGLPRAGIPMAKKTRRATKAKRSSGPSPIPAGFHSVTPYLVIDGAAQAIEWYKKAFGAKEINRSPVPGGKILNAQIKIGDSFVMMSDDFQMGTAKAPSTVGSTTVTLHVFTKDVDKLFQQALAAGAKEIMPLDNQFWGDRYGQLQDPFGHLWSLSQRIKMSKAEREEKQRAAMAMFNQGGQAPP